MHSSEQPTAARFDGASFRDPGGRVFWSDGRLFRTVDASLADDFGWVMQSGLLEHLVGSGKLVATREADQLPPSGGPAAWKVLESERIPFISYPYEWPFAALKRAALFHLDLHLAVLARGGTLVDASAYNVQFRGPQPVFIDVLSLRRYRDGELWAGHRQFCEQFLNPLLLQARFGIAYNAWFRGSVEGIGTREIASLLKPRHLLSWNVLAHVALLDRMQRSASRSGVEARAKSMRKVLPARAFRSLLEGLRRYIAGLSPAGSRRSLWSAYACDNTYSAQEMDEKRNAVRAFVEATGVRRVLDLGCNTGDYAAAALAAGAVSVVGVESDPATADLAFERAHAEGLAFLPLLLDAANPTPAQGWLAGERRAFDERADFDAVLALAFEHHLAIGRNIPLDQLAAWIVGLAPLGMVEFVPKEDPTIQRMLAFRTDIFGDYSEATFAAALQRNARIVRRDPISSTGRTLYWYERC